METPYLSIDDRIAYLRDKAYIDAEEDVTSEHRAFLARVNFHYFLGYGRNYRALAAAGQVPESERLSHMIDIIQMDWRLSIMLYEALKQVEWRLRALIVDEHCKLFPSKECFLLPQHFKPVTHGDMPLEVVLRQQTVKSAEPFVRNLLQQKAEDDGVKTLNLLSDDSVTEVLSDLHIWAQIDSWTLGALHRFIIESPADETGQTVWKLIADRLGISRQIIHTQLRSLIPVRNLVAHNARLWKRPTTYTPVNPKLYQKRGRNAGEKALYRSILAIASFLEESGQARDFLTRIDALLDENQTYALGIKYPLRNLPHD